MKKNDIYKVAITILAIVATLVVIFVSASILAPPKRSNKAEYALECGPQYVKLPKEKCDIKKVLNNKKVKAYLELNHELPEGIESTGYTLRKKIK